MRLGRESRQLSIGCFRRLESLEANIFELKAGRAPEFQSQHTRPRLGGKSFVNRFDRDDAIDVVSQTVALGDHSEFLPGM